MCIILLVLTAMVILVYFVIFASVLLGGAVGAWSLWFGMRSYHGTLSAGGKDEIIVLLVSLLLLVIASPFLFVVLLMAM